MQTGVKDLLGTILQVCTRLRVRACVFCKAALGQACFLQVKNLLARRQNAGQKALLGAWGGRAGSSRSGGERREEQGSRPRSGQWAPRRRRGRTALAGGSLPRRHFIQSEPQPRAQGAELPPPPPRSVSCSAPPRVGYLRAGAAPAPGDATWRAGHLASRPGRAAPPCRPRAAGASRCGAASRLCAGLRPGNLRAPAEQGPAVPFPLREVSDSSPSARGRRPRRGSESSDYLIAADTKPIFLPL